MINPTFLKISAFTIVGGYLIFSLLMSKLTEMFSYGTSTILSIITFLAYIFIGIKMRWIP